MGLERKVYGVGVKGNSWPSGSTMHGGYRDPFYVAWGGMLMRCYSDKYRTKYPTYKECRTAAEWLNFDVFHDWMAGQYWLDCDLDKDLLFPGNKIYAPEFCVFVPQWLNKFFNANRAQRGDFPIGVSRIRGSDKFEARIEIDRKSKTLGRFLRPEDAHRAYRAVKAERAVCMLDRYKASGQFDARVVSAVLAKVDRLLDFNQPWDGV